MTYNDSKTRTKNRKKIVEIARVLFIEQGVAHTSVKDIVLKAEMERKTFYNYFENKEEIADYIYLQEMCKFYQEGFGPEAYEGLETGYQKVEKYLQTITDHYIKFSHEMLFAVHYDYYFRKEATRAVIEGIYSRTNVVVPDYFIVEGVDDGSIDVGDMDPISVFNIVAQSIGSYASRIIFRGYKFGVKNVSIDFSSLYNLLQLHLNSIKAS